MLRRPFLSNMLTVRVLQVWPGFLNSTASFVPGRCSSTNIKMTKGLKRMFERKTGSKKKQFPGPVNVSSALDKDSDLTVRRKPAYTEGQKRRAHQVGRVLYDNIVHLVNSGQLSPRLASLAVEIVRVKVIPNFSAVNVYWMSSGSSEDEVTTQLLKENEGELRHLLTSAHVLGVIPRINFVKDKSRARYMEVESLLGKADFGPGFVPTQVNKGTAFRNINTANMLSPSEIDSLQDDFAQISLVNSHETKHSSEQYQDEGKDFSKRLQSQNDTTSLGQPVSLEVETLHNQIFSNSFFDENTLKLKTSSPGEESHGSENVCSQFRDDLYKVPHTQILNKVLLRKQKSGVRHSSNNELEVEESQLNLDPRNMKTLLQKKIKTKGRALQSDFALAGITGLEDLDKTERIDVESFRDDEQEDR